MIVTPRRILKSLWPIINQHGATYALSANMFIEIIQSALTSVRNYQWYIWKWQHYAEQFEDMVMRRWTIRLETKHPILKVDKFWAWRMIPLEWHTDVCDCPPCPPDACATYTPTAVAAACKQLKMIEKLPNDKLCQGEYQIAGSEVEGMGWENGNIIRMLPAIEVNAMYITYFRWLHVVAGDDYDAQIPIPNTFLNAIKYFILAEIIPNAGQYREWQELNYLQLARDEMEVLRKADTIMPDKVRFDTSYPLYWDQKSVWWWVNHF